MSAKFSFIKKSTCISVIIVVKFEGGELYMIEALREFARTTILSAVSSVVTVVLTGINAQTGEFNINWAIVIAVALTTLLTGILRFIDKYSYEEKKTMKLPF